MQFSGVLGGFAAKTGLDDASPDSNGSFSMLFDGEHEVTFIHDEED